MDQIEVNRREAIRTKSNASLQEAIDLRHQVAWINPANHPKTHTAGMCLASYCEWEPDKIANATLAAMEDANMHDMTAKIAQLLADNGYNVQHWL